MNVLYIATLSDTASQNGGYSAISKGHSRLLREYFEDSTFLHIVDINNIKNEVAWKEYDVCIILTHPSSFQNNAFSRELSRFFNVSKKRLLHIFWETSSLSNSMNFLWTTNLFTGFISSSKFVHQLIEDKKRNDQTNQILHYPIFDDYPFIKANIQNDFDAKLLEEKFSVLYVGQYTKRKGLEDTVIAFTQALSDKEDCQLILKYHQLSQSEVDADVMIKSAIMCNTKQMKASVYKVTDNLDTQGLCNLYAQSSLLLFPSRGEGMGLPAVEAGCIGIPVLYSDASSLPEFSEFEGNLAIECVEDTAYGMAQYDYEGNYWIPKMQDMVSLLKVYYSRWKKDRWEHYETKHNHKLILEKFGRDVCIKELKQILGE